MKNNVERPKNTSETYLKGKTTSNTYFEYLIENLNIGSDNRSLNGIWKGNSNISWDLIVRFCFDIMHESDSFNNGSTLSVLKFSEKI